jgi:crotonobetainyl-CoA:carnitine CoA-transferase CaiB-like acyl-CoA transferase
VVFLGLQNEREWVKFCEAVLERPELATDPRFDTNSRRVENGEELDEAIEGAFKDLTSEEVISRLDGARIANARMRTVQEFLDHPQLEARDRWREVGSPVGPIRALVPPVTMQGVESVMEPIPEVGEHTDAILEELDLDPDAVGSLREAGAV